MEKIEDIASGARSKTSDELNEEFKQQIKDSVRYYAEYPQQIDIRLQELQKEWDIEKTLEANAATLSLFGVIMAAFTSRRWLLLPGIVAAFLLQHALQGWCPPLPLFRNMGVRTKEEIMAEWNALRALKGDFDTATANGADRSPAEKAEEALHIAGIR